MSNRTLTRPLAAPSLSTEAWLLIAALSLPWGGSYFFYRILAGELPSFTIVLGRVGIATIALYALVRLRGGRLTLPWGRFLVMGILNNVIPFTLIVWAETRIDGGTAAILIAATPVCTTLVLHAAGEERLTPNRVAGILLGLVGVAILIGPQAWNFTRELPAQLACLGAALSYGFTALWSRRLPRVEPLHAAAGQCLCSTLVLLPLVAVIDRPWMLPMPGLGTWAALIGIALVSTALGYVIFFRIIAISGAANAMLVTLIVPVSAIILGALFLGDGIGANALAGMAVIALGLAAIDGRLWPH